MNTNVNNNESGNMEVMNQVIVKLNELKSVKMAYISKSKRPAAKFNKEVATYLLDNWDNLEQLKTCQLRMRKDMPHTTCTEVMGMYDARVAELQAELDKANEPEKPAETKADDKPKAKAKTANTKKEETKTAKSDKPDKKQAKEKSDKTKKRPGAPKTLKVGDRHKNGKWLWTEYEPGKFDWRTLLSRLRVPLRVPLSHSPVRVPQTQVRQSLRHRKRLRQHQRPRRQQSLRRHLL